MDDLPHIPRLPVAYKRTDSALHALARESQLTLVWTVRVLVVVTIAMMAVPMLWMWAVLPVTVLTIAYGLLMLVDVVEKRSRRRQSAEAAMTGETEPAASPPEAESHAPARTPEPPAVSAAVEVPASTVEPEVRPKPAWDRSEVSMPVLKHEVMAIGLAVAAIVVLAVLLAALFFQWKLLLYAAPVLFALVILGGWPVWMASIEEDLEEEARRTESA